MEVDDNLKLTTKTDIESNIGQGDRFRFIPKSLGYYCNNDSKCTEIPLEDMKINPI